MSVLDWIRISALLLSLAGCFLAAWRLAYLAIRGDAAEASWHRFLFAAFVGWVVARGILSLFPLWGFFIGISLDVRLAVDAALGVAGLIWARPLWGEFKMFKRPPMSLLWGEKSVAGLIVILLAMYAYRVTVPWGDDDEANAYGYLSKLIGGGYSFTDILVWGRYVADHAYLFLSQSWDGLLFGIFSDPWAARLNRFIDLLFCAGGIFFFLRILAVSRFWAFLAVAGFLSAPELCYLALSLKPDAPTMMFELGALLLVAYSFIFLKDGSLAQRRVWCSLLALVCASFALGNRMSGMIPFLLAWGTAIFLAVRHGTIRFPAMVFVLSFGVVCFMATGTGYIFNAVHFGNPLYPAQSPWPFSGGTYLYPVSHFKDLYNINGLPFGLLQGYLLFSVGIGVEFLDKIFHWSFFPMAQDKTISMGWPYPFLLTVFGWLFFIHTSRPARILGAIFIFQFVFWSLGIHYSRLFVASYTLAIMVCVILAGHMGETMRRGVLVFALASALLGVMVHGWWTEKRFFGPFLFSPQQRYQAAADFLGTKDYGEKSLPDFREISLLNRIFLSSAERPRVAIVSRTVIFHILFDKRICVDSVGSAGAMEGYDFLIVSPADAASASWLTKEVRQKNFPYEAGMTFSSGWKVYAARPVRIGK